VDINLSRGLYFYRDLVRSRDVCGTYFYCGFHYATHFHTSKCGNDLLTNGDGLPNTNNGTCIIISSLNVKRSTCDKLFVWRLFRRLW